MTERVLHLEREVQGIQRALEYSHQRLPVSGQPPRARTARTYNDGSYPIEPVGRVVRVTGTADSGTSNTLTLDGTASAINDEYLGRTLLLTDGAGRGQSAPIVSYVGTSQIVTISGTFSPVPDDTTEYSVEIRYPIIFLDKFEGDRQTVARKAAANLASRYLPPGIAVSVVEIEGQWYIVNDDGESTVIVPRTEISAATREVRGGSDKFTPGSGEVFLMRYDEILDELVVMLDADGNEVIKRIYNLREESFSPNTAQTFETESGGIYELEDGSPFELEDSSPSTNIIGPDTPIILAGLDRNGDLYIPEAPTAIELNVQNTIEGFSAVADGSEILLNQEKLQIVGDSDEFPSTLGDIIDVTISPIVAGVKVDIRATGDLFNFIDTDQIPPANTEPVALGESITVESVIDPAQLAFAITRVSPSKITNNFGRVFVISGDTGTAGAFPSDDILIQGGGTVSVDVDKISDQIIITITNSSPPLAATGSPSQLGAFPIGAIICWFLDRARWLYLSLWHLVLKD